MIPLIYGKRLLYGTLSGIKGKVNLAIIRKNSKQKLSKVSINLDIISMVYK